MYQIFQMIMQHKLEMKKVREQAEAKLAAEAAAAAAPKSVQVQTDAKEVCDRACNTSMKVCSVGVQTQTVKKGSV